MRGPAPCCSRQSRKLDPYLVTVIVPGDNSGSSQGIFGFVLVGGTLRQSLAFRAELVTALAGHLAGKVTGQGRGAAWLTVPTRRGFKLPDERCSSNL
jgi:hypothetical protein